MIKDILISEVMKKKVISLHPKDDISMASDIFDKYKIHHIPVLVNSKVVGIISLGDLLFMNRKNKANQDKYPSFLQLGLKSIEDIMTRNPYTIDSGSSLGDALDLMIERRVNCLPVVLNENELVGIITTFDLINYLNKQLVEC